MDLDIGCKRRLDPLLQGDWDVILPRTKPVSSGRAERPSIVIGHRGLSHLMHSIGRSLERFDVLVKTQLIHGGHHSRSDRIQP